MSTPRQVPAFEDLLTRIYPGVETAVQEAQQNGTLRFLEHDPCPGNRGIFALIDLLGFVVGYLSFETDLMDHFIPLVAGAFHHYLVSPADREVCCNVNGRNPRAIWLVQSLGFRLDMHGIKMAYQGAEFPERRQPGWQVRGYLPGMAADFAGLLDRAYMQIFENIGAPPAPHTRGLSGFTLDLEKLEAAHGVYSFWFHRTLVAVCLVRGSYIRDLAVDPLFQNHGFGRTALEYVVNDLLRSGAADIRLDVAMKNTGAQRFYLRHGFQIIGCFADHTYPPHRPNFEADLKP